jgi:peptide/nickel transport system permease protein
LRAAICAAESGAGAWMQAYIVRRLLLMIPVIAGVSVIIFVILRAIPGDVIDAQLKWSGNLSQAHE